MVLRFLFFISFFLLIGGPSRAQVPTSQDCLGAIAICQNTFTESNAYSGTGNYLNEIDTVSSCLKSGEKNDVWYTFSVQTSGSLCFTITPNLASDDYDWAVFDLTNNGCADIATTPSMEVSCNYAPNPGATGPNGLGGPQNEVCISVTAGDIYVINVSQFSPSPNGYALDFSASTASIFDNTAPAVQSVATPVLCGQSTLTFTFSENVLCNTVQDGDFLLSGPGGPYTLSGVVGAACSSGGTQEVTFSINVSPAINSGGSFNLCLLAGSGITDLCGNTAPNTCLPFTVTGLTTSVLSIIDVSCFNGSDGSATVEASGGTSPYTYVWATLPVQTGATVTGLSGGIYTYTATDATGCSGTSTVTIVAPTIIPQGFDVSCDSASCDGSASVTPVLGTPAYTYQWYDIDMNPIVGETNDNISNLCAGAYSVVTQDAAGCVDTTTIVLQLPAISFGINATSCIGSCDGDAFVTAIGGVAPYTYEWQNPLGVPIGQNDSTLDSVCTGMYYLQVTTGNACVLVDSVMVTEPVSVSALIPVSTLACDGTCDGTATGSGSGGNPPYTFLWNDLDAQTTSTATGLCAGIYTVFVTDAKGCGPDSASITIALNPPMTSTTSTINQDCDSVNGSATVVVSGGTTPYSYSWDSPTPSSTATATGLPAGNYTVVVTDSAGCTDTSSVTIGFIVIANAVLVITPISCNGECDGELSATYPNGDPLTSYNWSTKETSQQIGNLCPDSTYSVTVYDSLNCPATFTTTFINPDDITSTIVNNDETSCNSNDGSITVTAAGGTTPYTYTWSPSGSGSSESNLADGTYQIVIEDANGCPPDTQTVVLVDPPPIVISISSTDVICNGDTDGTVTVFVNSGGATPYTYNWSNGAGTSVTAQTGLSAGTYTVGVTDVNNCPETFATAIVTEPDAIDISLVQTCINGLGYITVSDNDGGTKPYSYFWNTGATTSAIGGLDPGSYSVTVTDVNNCPPDDETVIIPPCDISIPNAFTPNGNGTNDDWQIENLIFFVDCRVRVYNRWGDVVFKSKGYETPWDGRERITNAALPPAVYYYVIELKVDDNPDDDHEQFVAQGVLYGSVTIVK
ncbi:MAG: hypothetical protein COB85_04070 [Bacteroidetes bacterium]|nr:MAG: hypothetical protein COB85_04070 [Bacteroidota bacterium]